MYLRLLTHNGDFRLLYAGTLISLGGDWFLTVALLDLVLQLTGSATLASLMLLCQSLPIFIFTPIAGHAVDRLDRRKLMIVVDVMRAGACLLPLLTRSPAFLPFAFLGVIFIAIGSAYFEPAAQAIMLAGRKRFSSSAGPSQLSVGWPSVMRKMKGFQSPFWVAVVFRTSVSTHCSSTLSASPSAVAPRASRVGS